MKKVGLFLTFTVIATLLLSACGIQQPTPTSSPTPGSTSTGDQTIVTLADNGKTIRLSVGQSFLLKLGNDATWDISISDQSVIERVKNVTVILGAQGIYDALKQGTTTLSATGDPVCNQAVPSCKAPSILFSVTIDVSG